MNPPSPRLKLLSAKQSGPVRNPMAPPPPPPRTVQEKGAPQDPVTAAGAAVCGALENGVSTAYALIDEYMRRGQDAARNIFNDPTRRGNMSDERPGFPGGFNPAPPSNTANPFNSANPLSMLTEQWMMAMRFWSQAMSSFAPGSWPPAGMNPFAAQQDTTTPRVSVKISSSRPVEVTANLYPGLGLLGLTSEPLRAEASKAGPIDPAEISRESGVIQVSIKIGDKQPVGRYHGYIRKKADGNVAGELTVVIT